MLFFGFAVIFLIWILFAFIISFIKEAVTYFDLFYWFIVWILFILLRIDKLKVENGIVSLNGKNLDDKNTTGYMDKYVGTPRIHLTVNGEKILFEPYVNRYSRSDTSNKITAIGFFLKEKGIPEIQYQKIYREILLLRLVILLGIMAPLIITV